MTQFIRVHSRLGNITLPSFFQHFGITFLIQVGLLSTLVWSIESSGWVESVPLVFFVLPATVLASVLSNVFPDVPAKYLIALLVGLLFSYLGGLYITEADGYYSKFGELHQRVGDWLSAVAGEDASTDALPLAVTIMFLTWVISYFTSWGLFKYRNVWATIVPTGTLIVLNLTYLPDSFSMQLIVYFCFTLFMIVHVTNLTENFRERSIGIFRSSVTRIISYTNGLVITGLILGIIFVMPVGKTPPSPLAWLFEPLDRVFYDFQDELYRIFAAIPSHNPTSIRFFGSVLPLVRPIPVDENPIFFARSKYPLYWSAIAYDEYTSKAWKVDDMDEKPVISEAQKTELEDEESGSGVFYKVDMEVNSPYILSSGDIIDLDIDASANFPTPADFSIDLTRKDEVEKLPEDLRKMVSEIADAGKDSDKLISIFKENDILVSKIVKNLTATKGVVPFPGGKNVSNIDIESSSYHTDLLRATKQNGTIVELEVSRKPLSGSTVFIDPSDRIGRGDSYSGVTVLDTSTEENLRMSSGKYPPAILDRYLQLPDSLTPRVTSLASNLVVGKDTAYDKAVAIETYIRGFNYSLVVQDIPHDVDTVDHFLFNSQEGPSDHFASAMAVMLRTQGIPTRLVLGFAPGLIDMEEQGFLVRDKDSHSWPEVYFKGIGWIPFEPTPIYDTRKRGIPESPFGGVGLLSREGLGDEIVEAGGMFDQTGETLERDDFGGPEPGGEGPPPIPVRFFGTPLGVGGMVFALTFVLWVFTARLIWYHFYVKVGIGDTIFKKLQKMVVFLGFPYIKSQTEIEFSNSLSDMDPDMGEDLNYVTSSFVRERYGGISVNPMEKLKLIWAWRRIKDSLIRQG